MGRKKKLIEPLKDAKFKKVVKGFMKHVPDQSIVKKVQKDKQASNKPVRGKRRKKQS